MIFQNSGFFVLTVCDLTVCDLTVWAFDCFGFELFLFDYVIFNYFDFGGSWILLQGEVLFGKPQHDIVNVALHVFKLFGIGND